MESHEHIAPEMFNREFPAESFDCANSLIHYYRQQVKQSEMELGPLHVLPHYAQVRIQVSMPKNRPK